jgi:hypothetical protein
MIVLDTMGIGSVIVHGNFVTNGGKNLIRELREFREFLERAF